MVKEVLFISLILTGLLNAQYLTPSMPIPGGASCRFSWHPKEPKEGEIVTVTFEITSNVDASQLHIGCVLYPNTKIVGPTGYDGSIKKGETKRFVVKIKLYPPRGGIRLIRARALGVQGLDVKLPSGNIMTWGDLAERALFLVFDESTKTFVGRGEYARRRPEPPLPPEYTYDIILGQFTPSCLRRHDDAAREIRNQMEELKSLDSTLTDLEALEMLHDMEYEMVVRYGIKGKEAIPILVDARRLMEELGLSKWEAVDRMIKARKKGKSFFFRADRNSIEYSGALDLDSLKSKNSKADVTFTGVFKYKKHIISRERGLDTASVDMPLRKGKIWIWGYWLGQGLSKWGPIWTDDNGRFTYTIYDVGNQACFCPIVYLRGPRGAPEFDRIKVISDTMKFSYPDGRDSTLWRFKWKKWDDLPSPPPPSWDFGFSFAAENRDDDSLYPKTNQPKSGAANIYDMMLKGYEYLIKNYYTTPDTIYQVVAMWEPGDTTLQTCFKPYLGLIPDSIFIAADTTGGAQPGFTDEWDDFATLHEFGHHVMHRCAEMPHCTTQVHYWHQKYPADTNLAYTEGWPSFYASIVTNNIYLIDTRNRMGRQDSLPAWYNIEDPWQFFPGNPSMFRGGPWCEGAVCGAFWDIADFTDEIYPVYPDTGFPDTGLADSLPLGFDEIWNISDDYKFSGHYCWTIFDFLRGWGSYNYDYQRLVDKIVLHHRIRWGVPDAPTGLRAYVHLDSVYLHWHPNLEPDIWFYKLYSKIDTLNAGFIEMWPSSDTAEADTTVIPGKSYWYGVTAVDSTYFTSELSDSVLVHIPTRRLISSSQKATGPPMSRMFQVDRRIPKEAFRIHLTFSSSDSIFYACSFDTGKNWTRYYVGTGEISSIILDRQNNPAVLIGRWQDDVWPYGWQKLYYSRFIGNRFTLPYLLFSTQRITKPVEDLRIPIPSAGIAINDSITCLWVSHYRENSFADYWGVFYAPDSQPIFYFDTLFTQEHPEKACHSLIVDDSARAHAVWEKWSVGASEIYYQFREEGVWSPRELVSSSALYSYLEYRRNKLYLVWDGWVPPENRHRVAFRSKTIGAPWDTIMTVFGPSPWRWWYFPVNAGGWNALWQDGDILHSRFNGVYWESPETLMVTPTDSRYAQSALYQTDTDTSLFIVWTEGDTAPYSVEFLKKTVPRTPLYYADCGREEPTPYTIRRKGYISFGIEPYKDVDYDSKLLKYHFKLEKEKRYRIDLTYYFEKKDMSDPDEEIDLEVSEDGGPKITQVLLIDCLPLDSSAFGAGEIRKVSVWVPEPLYQDGIVYLDIDKKKGRYAVCGEIAVQEFEGEERDYGGVSGIQEIESGPIPLRFSLDHNIPNPFVRCTQMRYQIPKQAKVSLKIYNSCGQLVRKLVDKIQNPGFYRCRWDGQDDLSRTLANGVYFCRMKADEYCHTRKIVLLR